MKDLEKHKVYLKMCIELAALSKCSRNKVASMLVNNGRIISTGLNGTPSGHINCIEHFKDHDKTTEEYKKEHSAWSLKHEIHGEMAAIGFAAKNGIEIVSGTVLYCTHEPCDNCLKHIAGVGIKEIYYASKYYHNITAENTFNLSINHIPVV